jgi:CotS family spore coat protein
VLEYSPHPQGFLLGTDQGYYLLKQISKDERKKLPFVNACIKHLRENGFKYFFRLLPNKDGKYTVPISGKRYCLIRWVKDEGNQLNYRNLGVRLAQFHHCSANFKPTSLVFSLAYTQTGSWVEQFAKNLAAFEAYRERLEAEDAEFTLLDEFLLKQYTYLTQLAETALEYLDDLSYKKLSQKLKQKSKLSCLNEIHDSLFIDTQGNVRFSNPFAFIIDVRARDIARVIQLAARERNDQKNVFAFLDGYQTVAPLEPEEYALVYAFVLFPQSYFDLVHRDATTSQQSEEKANQIVNLETLEIDLKENEMFLRSFPQFVEEHYHVVIPRVDWLS